MSTEQQKKNIRLVITDIDGTLVPAGSGDLNPAYFEVIRQLTDRGIAVAVASGRHAVSVRKVFAPVLDRVWIVSQNGAVIEKNGSSRVLKPIPAEWIREFWQDLSSYPEVEGILDSAERTYAPFGDTEMYRIVTEEYGFNTVATGGWAQIPEDVFSMTTVYHPRDCEAFCKKELVEKWKGRLEIFATGQIWADCVMPGISKGLALEQICREEGIDPECTAAFGDNMNDIPMIEAAGIGYAVDTARVEVRQAADRVIPGYREDGVLEELRKFLAEASDCAHFQ